MELGNENGFWNADFVGVPFEGGDRCGEKAQQGDCKA